MKYSKIKDFPKHKVNPFVQKVVEEMRTVKKTQTMNPSIKDEIQLIVSQDGDVKGHTSFVRYIEVDEQRFAKLYLSEFQNFFELSKPAIRVFGYIINNIPKNQDTFIVRLDKAMAYTKYSQANSVISGLAELVKYQIIARTAYDNEYYINPMIVFNGDRVAFTKAIVKKIPPTPPNQINLFNEQEV